MQWIKWQLDGNKYLNISDKCPYCTSAIIELKETILSVSKEYDSNSIQHLNKLIEIIENLGDYFSDSTKDSLNKIIKNNKGLDKESINYLIEVKNQIDTLKEKMISLKEISFFSIKDESNIEEKISLLKIDLDLLGHLRTPKTKIFVDEINKSLNEVLGNIGMLKGEINKQKAGIQKTIQKNKEEINNFLKYAGYSYYVDIVDEINSYKMKLLHFDYTKNIENSSSHLSFGEKNAFALVLFMYECISKNPDIIILDDPISSFDKNKKFAITEKLFRGSGSLQKRTVVMLTHDFEPIVDIVKTLKGRFQPIPSAAFLRNNNGNLIELPIEKNDIQSASNVCIENLNISNNLITKLIYTRRYFEIANNLGFEYHILSSLFHKREVPTDEALNPIPELDISTGISSIELYIPNFIYSEVYSIITDFEKLKSQYHASTNCYEKIQLFRIMYSGSEVQSVVQKFINETFHIENDYIMQLNPMKYEVVPQYIIDSCDELINAN
ncbi:MAG: AAA family ATPase [Saprospiraceae bacterium]|nr:AAA family ATPase [Saprospiraceae bacterium]